MAKQRYVYMKDEVEEKLKKVDNVSKLINDLLLEHFRKINPELMTVEELEKQIKIEELKKEYKLKMEKVENG